jgi:hypothetical protein
MIATLPACGGGDSGAGSSPALTPLRCEVAIVGAGAGGLYTAYQLSQNPAALGVGKTGADVCLFEKESEVGGRLKAVRRDEGDPRSPLVGVGGRRILPGHTVILDLANELGVALEQPEQPLDLIYARGEFALSDDPTGNHDGKQDRLLPLYGYDEVTAHISPDILDSEAGGDVEYAAYLQLFAIANDPTTDFSVFPDWGSYIQANLGQVAYEYVRDMSRFRGEMVVHDSEIGPVTDFPAVADVRSFVEFLETEFDDRGLPLYPVGSMQALTVGMANKSMERGVRVYRSEAVLSLDRSGAGYLLTTAAYRITAARVILAVPPIALSGIQGEVIDEIRSQPEYNFKNTSIVTITQWWPYPWWEGIRYKNDSSPAGGIWRAWMDRSAGCGTFLEIPLEPSSQTQNVTRSVYAEDGACIEYWRNTFAERGLPGVEAEIEANLELMLNGNGITTPDLGELPPPDKTYFQYWPAGWSFLGAGTPTTNEEIVTWALDPLRTGEWVSLVGEAYNPHRSGWSLAAYQSAVHLLNERYGFALSPEYEPPFVQ